MDGFGAAHAPWAEPGLRASQARWPAAGTICVVLHDLSGGGSERIALRLANRWAELGRTVRLICGVVEGPLLDLVGPKVRLEALSPAVPRGPGSRWRLAAAVREILRHRPCDVLYLPGNFHWPVARAVEGLGRERPAVVAQLSNPLRRDDRGLLRQALFEAQSRLRLRNADLILALTRPAQAEAEAVLGHPGVRLLPLPALEDCAPSPRPPPQGPPLILAIGRLTPQKDFRLALEAFARLRQPQARLAILGEGPERADLEALVLRLGLSGRVEMPGYVADVRPWLDRARLLLVSSRFEGYGAVIVEALAAGRPVVATPCGGAVDELLLDRRGGSAAERPSPRALAMALEGELSGPPRDPAKLAEMVRGFRLGPVAEAYLEAFDSLPRAVATGWVVPRHSAPGWVLAGA